jgi:DNA invertase Pin-like site-specific DNA recombinase
MRQNGSRPIDTGKLAVVYLRQSTPGQLRDNVVATEEQYRLREIPASFGFPEERILVVDEDLGVSGQTIAGRKGMLRVLELLEQGQVSCVVVRDIGRLTRDEFNADIGLIARQCYQSGALIVTPDKVYDPADPSDQLMLGLQGLLAGWDRANIVRRMEHHRRAKQARGVNINGAVPPGYEKIASVPKNSPEHGKLRITSDEKVRDRVTLVLRKGLELGGVLAVVRFLRAHDLKVPTVRGEEERVVTGADKITRVVGTGRRVVRWVEATRDRVTRTLKNPTYSGAIVNGRRAVVLDKASGKKRWVTRRAYEHCLVMRDAHPAYITWEEHLELLRMIARNNHAKTYGTGQALLSGLGLLRCGVCGAAMVVQYNNPERKSRGRVYQNTPYVYMCTSRTQEGGQAACQSPAGPYLDRAATDLVLFALGELDLEGLEAALADRKRQAEEKARFKREQVEALTRRAKILEDAIADAEKPEARTRLVARFEETLTALEAAQAAVNKPEEPDAPLLSEAVLRRLEVFRDPESAWERFSQRTRKEVLRALAKGVTIYPDLDGYILVFDWQSGERAAAKVRTVRRKKVFTVPEDVLALFSDEAASDGVLGRIETRASATHDATEREARTLVLRRVAARRERGRPGAPGSPHRDGGRCRRR